MPREAQNLLPGLFSGANDHLGGSPLPFLNFIVSWVLLSCRNEDVFRRHEIQQPFYCSRHEASAVSLADQLG
jgi:hypothetical protein